VSIQTKVADLIDYSGLSLAFIARHAGVHRSTLERIYRDEQKDILHSAGVKIEELWDLYRTPIEHFGPYKRVDVRGGAEAPAVDAEPR
jgi:lambda repressor-like predicted transcriptional regulator